MAGPPMFSRVMIRATRIAATITRGFSRSVQPLPADRHGVRGGLMALAALAVAHFAVPGHPQLATHGIPLGPAGTVIVSGVLAIAILHRTARVGRTVFTACGGAMIALLAARLVVGAGIPQNGWSARYFANEAWAGAPEWSSDFRSDETTRVDRRIWFQDDEFPAHYLNGVSFDRGIRREVTEPMSVEWRGYIVVDDPYQTRIAVKARGTATVLLDNGAVVTASSLSGRPESETSLELEPGLHVVTVRYMKPRDTDGLMQLEHSLTVTAAPPPLERAGGRAVRLRAARAIDAVLLFVFAFAVIQTIWRHWQPSMLVPAALIGGFGWQGWWRARPLADRVVSLTSGDDWFGFESSARDILHHGPLMTLGKPVGEGAAYFFHPLYCYFLAAIHGVTGESLFGPVFVQFLILAAVAILLWRLAAALFGARPALIGLVALVTIFELDFARYYTITLLSENLYILTVTLTLVAFIASTRTRSWRARVVPVATVALLWLAAIAPVTIRNAIVARRFVLISDGLGAGFIKYNIPAS